MPDYYCKYCNYKTKYSSNFSIHKKSQKHLNLINIKDISQDISTHEYTSSTQQVHVKDTLYVHQNYSKYFNCTNCDFKTIHKTSYYRHKKTCNNSSDSESDTVKELKLKMEFMKKEQELKDKLEQEKLELYKKMERDKTELLTNFMNNANILLNKTTDNNKITTQAMQNISMSALNYANDKFKNTPVLIPLDNFNINELSFENAEEKGQLTEILIYNAKQKSLDKLLGDHIIKYYKKENPENQSFHSTDCSRLNYIVRELIENTPTWIVDKNGIKICKDIMKPLIKKCINALLDYQKELLQKMGNGDYNKQKDVELIIDIIMSIDSGNLENDINKYIAPFFNLNKA